jgi:hypothetical protein
MPALPGVILLTVIITNALLQCLECTTAAFQTLHESPHL